MKFVVHYQLYAWEGDGEEFFNFEEAKNFFYAKAQEKGIRRVRLGMYKGKSLFEVMEIDKALWVIYVQFIDKGADMHVYRTESHEAAEMYFNMCISDKTVRSVRMFLENTKEKVEQRSWIRDLI